LWPCFQCQTWRDSCESRKERLKDSDADRWHLLLMIW
jgi:hypothetical protein